MTGNNPGRENRGHLQWHSPGVRHENETEVCVTDAAYLFLFPPDAAVGIYERETKFTVARRVCEKSN